jgi:hypothetical protein
MLNALKTKYSAFGKSLCTSVTVRRFGCQVSKLPLKCAVVSLTSVVEQRLKCNTGKVCNCFIYFLLTMVHEKRIQHFISAQRLSQRTV